MLVLIAAGEIGFWVVPLAGLLLRYLTPLRRTSVVALASVPVVDLVLLVATVVHLRGGAPAAPTDGLAAVYLGVSVAGGGPILRWADARVAYWLGKGPKPVKPPRTGPEHAQRERRGWYRHLAAYAIGCVLLLGGTRLVTQPGQADLLLAWIKLWSLILGIDFLISFSYTLWPRKPRAS